MAIYFAGYVLIIAFSLPIGALGTLLGGFLFGIVPGTALSVTAATVGEPYQYQAAVHDPDGTALAYVLYEAPTGMTINAQTGLISWLPATSAAAATPVVVMVYDRRGGSAARAAG